MSEIESFSYMILIISWIMYLVLSSNMGNDLPDNRSTCGMMLVFLSVITVAVIIYERNKRKKIAPVIHPIAFPGHELKNADPATLTCIAYFEGRANVHVTELSPFMGLTPPTLDELFRKSIDNANSKIPYDNETQSFDVPEGYILYITKDRQIQFRENFGTSEIISQIMLVDVPQLLPVVAYGKGQSIDIEKIKIGKLDAEYDPNTQILSILSGGIYLDNLGNMQMHRVSNDHVPLKIILTEPTAAISGEKEKKETAQNIKVCQKCEREASESDEFCPDCGSMCCS